MPPSLNLFIFLNSERKSEFILTRQSCYFSCKSAKWILKAFDETNENKWWEWKQNRHLAQGSEIQKFRTRIHFYHSQILWAYFSTLNDMMEDFKKINKYKPTDFNWCKFDNNLLDWNILLIFSSVQRLKNILTHTQTHTNTQRHRCKIKWIELTNNDGEMDLK